MEKKMSTNQVRETVDHVSKALDSAKTEEDQKNALTNLQNEIEANTKKMNPAEQNAYMTQVTKELEWRADQERSGQ
jgi:CRISPR/Cas system CSM-associated protein Csm5 (group 7 of RAMP superfamily)